MGTMKCHRQEPSVHPVSWKKRNRIIDLINADPVVVPPVVKPPVSNVKKYVKMTPGTYRFLRNANLWNFNFDTQAKFTAVKSFKAGETIDIVGKAIWKNGTSEYYMTAYSFGNADTTGFRRLQLV